MPSLGATRTTDSAETGTATPTPRPPRVHAARLIDRHQQPTIEIHTNGERIQVRSCAGSRLLVTELVPGAGMVGASCYEPARGVPFEPARLVPGTEQDVEALGRVHEESSLIEAAAESFEALGISWYAAQTAALV